LVVAADGALVVTEEAFVATVTDATVIGVSNRTVSVRRLRRYAASCFALSVGRIS
jgi:hypothetical protein